MDIFKLGDKILALLEMVFGFWNNQVSLVFSMLGQSPVNFKGGGPWQVVESIEPIFVGVGSSLVVLFFVIGFCSESVDVREEMRFEVILRMLIRLGLAEWFVANNVTIMKAFFTTIGNLVNALSAGQYTTLTIDSTQAEVIKNLGFGESLIMLILAALSVARRRVLTDSRRYRFEIRPCLARQGQSHARRDGIRLGNTHTPSGTVGDALLLHNFAE